MQDVKEDRRVMSPDVPQVVSPDVPVMSPEERQVMSPDVPELSGTFRDASEIVPGEEAHNSGEEVHNLHNPKDGEGDTGQVMSPDVLRAATAGSGYERQAMSPAQDAQKAFLAKMEALREQATAAAHVADAAEQQARADWMVADASQAVAAAKRELARECLRVLKVLSHQGPSAP